MARNARKARASTRARGNEASPRDRGAALRVAPVQTVAPVQATAPPTDTVEGGATVTSPLPITDDQARRADLLWAAGITAAMFLVFVLLEVFQAASLPVLVALAGAYALDPVIDWLEARGMSRTLGVVLLFVVVGLAIAGFLLYLVPTVVSELAKLPGFFLDIANKAVPRLESLLGQALPSTMRDAATALSEKRMGLAQKALPTVAGFAMSALGGTASVVVTVIGLTMIPVLGFYLLRDYDRIVAFGRGLLPRRYESLVSSRFAEVDGVLSAFIRGQLTVGAILSVIYATGLSFAQLELAVVIGMVAGFGNMVPYIGPAFGAVLAILSLAISWQGPWQLLVVAGTFAVGMTAEGMVITPRVLGGKVGLSAVTVMIAVLVFGELFGFAGVLLAVPVTASLKVVARVVLLRYQRSRLYRGES